MFGTAAISIRADITLRPGDIVAMEDGLQVFVGSTDRKQPTGFTPIRNHSGPSPQLRQTARTIRVAEKPQSDTKALTYNARVVFGFEPLGTQFLPAQKLPANRKRAIGSDPAPQETRPTLQTPSIYRRTFKFIDRHVKP